MSKPDLLQPRVVRVPGDDRNAEVACQLQEVLGRGGRPAIPAYKVYELP
jgi:hypothetical protein